MILKTKELSDDPKLAIESLLGRTVREDEAIRLSAVRPEAAPPWLEASWESSKQLGLDALTMEEIDAEIDAARKARHSRQQ